MAWYKRDFGRDSMDCEGCKYYECISSPYCTYYAERLEDCPRDCDVGDR